MSEPESRIKTFILREFMYDCDEASLDSGTMLIDEAIIDSLKIFVLVPFLQKEFAIRVEPTDITLRNFESVGAIGSLVERKRREQQP